MSPGLKKQLTGVLMYEWGSGREGRWAGMCTGRVCLVPAANDFGKGVIRDFSAGRIKKYKISLE